MRRKLPPAPPEMPARLRCYDLDEWSDPADDPVEAVRLADRRWFAALVEWHRDHGVSPLDSLLLARDERQRVTGCRSAPFRTDR